MHAKMNNNASFFQNKKGVFIMFDLNGVPQGLGMALTRNEKAMQSFSRLSENERRKFIELSRSVRSKQEMNRLVNKLEDGNSSLI